MESPEELARILAQHDYLADDSLATVLFLALRLGRPLLLEGEAGVGKTEVAKVLARWTGGELLRLQCYDGIDVSQAVYEWDYARQLLHLRAAEATGAGSDQTSELERSLYSEAYLVRRPLLRAIAGSADGPVPVLLIDEIDRADDEFEAYLLEILSDFTVSVPELGTFRAERPPVVIVTSNRTRDVHDALKRRCLYHWVDHPTSCARWHRPASCGDGSRARLPVRWPPRQPCSASRACTSPRAWPRRSTGRRLSVRRCRQAGRVGGRTHAGHVPSNTGKTRSGSGRSA